MHPITRALWALVAVISYLGPVADAAGVLDIGLVFPRANETYEPTDRFPILFAIQNPELARHMEPWLWFRILNGSTGEWDTISEGSFDLTSANMTEQGEEPYLLWAHRKIDGEGPVLLMWQPFWSECDATGADGKVWFAMNNSDTFMTAFEVRPGGRKADLVAATADAEECPDQGLAINVTGTGEAWRGPESVLCAVLDFSSPTPAANPCRVKIDQAAVESKEAADLEDKCHSMRWERPAVCPDESLAAWKFGGSDFVRQINEA